MTTIETLYEGCASLLRQLREETGTTRERMADILDVDIKTYRKFENGEAAPRVPEFINLYSALGKDALRSVLDMVYPDQYAGLTAESSPAELRQALVYYFQHTASDHEIRELDFLIFGGHGSNWKPQLEEWTMLDHLPMTSRLLVAQQIWELYSLAHKLGTLKRTDHVMPDEETFLNGLEKGKDAAYSGRNSYTTATE